MEFRPSRSNMFLSLVGKHNLQLADVVRLPAVDQRKEEPFEAVGDLKKRLPADIPPPKVAYDVRSAYFEVNVATMFGRAQRYSRALLHRPSGAAVRILWQQQESVTTTSDTSGGTT